MTLDMITIIMALEWAQGISLKLSGKTVLMLALEFPEDGYVEDILQLEI